MTRTKSQRLNEQLNKEQQENELPFLKRFLKIYNKETSLISPSVAQTITRIDNVPKKIISRYTSRHSKEFVLQMVKKCRQRKPEYTTRTITHLIRLKRQSKPAIQKAADNALQSLFYQPLVLSTKDENRGLNAVRRCAQLIETDDFIKKNKMQKHLTILTRSNSQLIRKEAFRKLQELNKRHHVYDQDALENVLIDIKQSQIAIKENHQDAGYFFETLMTYVDSVSPKIKNEAENAIQDCLNK